MKLLVVDDHTLIREGLRNVLQELGPGIEILEARDLGETLATMAATPDLALVLLDLNLPDSAGEQTLERVCAAHAGIPVIVLSATDDPNLMARCLGVGAMGFVAKSSVSSVLVTSIRLVLSGSMAVPPQVRAEDLDLAAIVASRRERQTARPAQRPGTADAANADEGSGRSNELGLTDRQIEVLHLMMQGKSNKAICRDLQLAESTVKLHVSAILRALRVSSRTQAVVEAARLGIDTHHAA